jgi:hypothetical protein
MATVVGSNVEIVREYTERVFNGHNPELASAYVTSEVKCEPSGVRLEVATDQPGFVFEARSTWEKHGADRRSRAPALCTRATLPAALQPAGAKRY